jgi:AbrB family looped-hinge helix DNA binding protein
LDRGGITIPARLRQAYGLKPNDELIIEPSDGELLLRPVANEMIELYTDERIAEFFSDEDALGPLLPRDEPCRSFCKSKSVRRKFLLARSR